ncbi:SRPBCC domain-containing protein [Paenibacillus zeisoli]|uniref:SRPBCC domain-containing protein n=1 Tax=Paenibacillus zeisoli TaxID=2496267 RepID=A0A3S1B8V2_9BACL|nr:SRPBCC domain-containing protein [Paenibacillus zeisoli]RUT35584.1 SRPBCC domain-containing protein [Paenibacillus zeisoli]
MSNSSSNSLPDIQHTFTFNAPIQKVWEAVSTSEGMAAWFMPNDFKAEIGHEFYLDAGPYGKNLCKVTELEPPDKLSFSWAKNWTITFELKELEGQTEFTLTHAGWDAADQIPYNNMNHGWAEIGQRLGKYVQA